VDEKQIYTYDCPKCKKTFPINNPVIIKDSHGYTSAVHECGNGYIGFVLSSKNPDLVEALSKIRGQK
jgi:hypothetical protein